MNQNYQFFNEDCIDGCRKHIADNSIDLIITDPPYGIRGDTLHKHYNRNEANVLDGYIEIPEKEYPEFSRQWIKQAERILKPGASIYIVSGYTNLIHILNALKETKLKEINHLIWKFNFGVYTKNKYISSHYHILYYVKSCKKPVFNTYCRFNSNDKNVNNGSLNYSDREDVWIINKEYKPNQTKNKNELPKKLLDKIIQYSSRENDIVCDLFLGSFSTAKVALGLKRKAVGFEKSETAFNYQIGQIKQIKFGGLLEEIKSNGNTGVQLLNQGKSWSKSEIDALLKRFAELYKLHKIKKKVIDLLSEEFQRGYFSILNVLDKHYNRGSAKEEEWALF